LLVTEKGFRCIQVPRHLAELVTALEQHKKQFLKNVDVVKKAA